MHVIKMQLLLKQGSNINAAAEASEISVMIGSSDICVVKTVASDRLFCTPPKKDDDGSSGRHPVVVSAFVLKVHAYLELLL